MCCSFLPPISPPDCRPSRPPTQRQVEAAKLELCSRNEEASREKCTAALQELYSEMEQRISDGVYFVPGGHQLFLGDQRALVERYRALPGKGVKVGRGAAPAQRHHLTP